MFLILVDNERAQIYCPQLQNRSVDNNNGPCDCNCNVGVLQSANCDKAWPWQLHKHRATKKPTPKRMQFHSWKRRVTEQRERGIPRGTEMEHAVFNGQSALNHLKLKLRAPWTGWQRPFLIIRYFPIFVYTLCHIINLKIFKGLFLCNNYKIRKFNCQRGWKNLNLNTILRMFS